MVIQGIRLVHANDLPRYSWSRLARFQNVGQTAEWISTIHKLPKNQFENAKRQAEQIKHCLLQAREYFDAAQVVSLATRPVQLYYAAMSMALAEILLKQTGESRLSRLREHHNSHGLQMSLNTNPRVEHDLKTAAKCLVAKAQIAATGAKGTFEVWRRSARELPVGGKFVAVFQNGGTQQGYRQLLVAMDTEPPRLPDCGVSLFECLVELPYMQDLLNQYGLGLNMIRANLSATTRENQPPALFEAIIHPAPPEAIDAFGEQIRAHAGAVNHVDIVEMPSGYVIRYPLDAELPHIVSWPNAVCLNSENTYFSCSSTKLPEFGHLYVALHLCGMFSRYFPDIWHRHIEKSSALAMAIDELCDHAIDRLPLLCLSELTRTYMVPRN